MTAVDLRLYCKYSLRLEINKCDDTINIIYIFFASVNLLFFFLKSVYKITHIGKSILEILSYDT